MTLKQLIADFKLAINLPNVAIDLGYSKAADNDPFFQQIVQGFYNEATARFKYCPLLQLNTIGVCLMPLPKTHEEYLKALEGSARRNVKKAIKKGCRFERIEHNDYLAEIGEIHRSAPVRQGAMPEEMLNGDPEPINNGVSTNPLHDYPYFGVFIDDKLVAYAGCFVANELIQISTFFGHDAYKSDGVVPFLIAEVARYAIEHFPSARYYNYDKYFGAGKNLRRFKRKFRFDPYKVTWILG